MPLPINIDDLLSGHVVEWDRLEFKEGWNPEAAIKSMCAFANDFHNWGGGYFIVGIAEKDGQPVLPPKGLTQSEADKAQRKLLELGHQLDPNYHPICEPVTYQGKLILVVWVPGGEMRPYRAPTGLGKGNTEKAYYIRIGANTVKAKGALEQELMTLANRIPFDDRQNTAVSFNELRPTLLQSFLAEIGSDLSSQALDISVEELGRRMEIVRGPSEAARPVNVGLLFFSEDPSKWFKQTQIDIVHMPDGPGGKTLIERTFKGPLSTMLRDALGYLKNQFVTEYVAKSRNEAEADRYFNVPYAALEEALVNAIYHRSYEEREPVEVRITPEEVTILSFPGPDVSVKMEDLQAGRSVARRYRNRRIGEFLKELELSEGRSTGIPTILRALEENGSGKPIFETDDARTSFLVRLPVRAAPKAMEFVKTTSQLVGASNDQGLSRDQDGTKSALSRHQVKVMFKCLEASSLAEILSDLDRSNRTKFRNQVMNPLLDLGYLRMTIPEKPTSRNQKYQTTQAGIQAIHAINGPLS